MTEKYTKKCSDIFILGLLLSAVCFAGCKGKKQIVKADSNSAEPNIVQTVKSNSNDSNVNIASPNVTAKVIIRQVLAAVNGINIYKDDFDKKVDSQINGNNGDSGAVEKVHDLR